MQSVTFACIYVSFLIILRLVQIMDENLQRCLSLLKENEEEVQKSAGNALLTICDNILSYPNDKQYREVHLNDSIIVEKLLPTAGAMECLFDIGFVEVICTEKQQISVFTGSFTGRINLFI